MATNLYNSGEKNDFMIFGKCMINEFDQNVACVHAILKRKVSSKTSTAFKYMGDIIPFWESPLAATRDVIKRGIADKKDAQEFVEASKLAKLACKWRKEGEQMKQTLCQAALELFVSFYWNITRVTTKQSIHENAIETLAKVAVSNFMTWYENQPDDKPFSVQIITEGVIANMQASSLLKHNQSKVYDKLTKTEYNAIKLFTKTDLVVNDGSNAQRYYVQQSKQPSKYGYRFLFEHEMKKESDVLNDYVQIPSRNINLVKPELEKGAWRELLTAIREEDPNLMESRLKEHMEQAIQRIVQILLSDFIVEIQNKFIDATTSNAATSSNAGTNSDIPTATDGNTYNVQGDKSNMIIGSRMDYMTLNIQ